jgi:hypothetical protein
VARVGQGGASTGGQRPRNDSPEQVFCRKTLFLKAFRPLAG